MNPKHNIRKARLLTIFIALALSLPASAGRPSPSSGTLEALFNLSTVAGNHTIGSYAAENERSELIISAPQEGAETSGGLVGYWRFNNDSSVGEDYNATNASYGTQNHGMNDKK